MTILVVDDDEQNLYQLRVLLTAEGYAVVISVNGAEALARARQRPPDLVVSDILMPVMDGFTLCREWKHDERLRGIPFVFYTATYTNGRDRDFALGLGAERFLVKPEEPEVLLRTIAEVLDQARRSDAAPAPAAEGTEGDAGYLLQYNQTLVRKLEQKVAELQRANRELEREVTERRQAEDRVKRLARLVDLTRDVIILRDLEGRILFANPAAEQLSGWTVAETQGRSISELGYRDPALFEAATREVLARGEWQGEVPVRRRSGQEIVVFSRWTLLRDDRGRPESILSISTDVTGHKRVEQALAESEARLRGLYESVPIGLYRTSPEGRVLLANPTLLEMLGYATLEDLATRDLREEGFGPGSGRAAFLERIEREGGVRGVEATWHRRDGTTIEVRESARAVRGEDGRTTHYDGFVEDVTERKLAEARMAEQMDELRRWHEATLGREGRILELKREVNELLVQAGQPPRYLSAVENEEQAASRPSADPGGGDGGVG